MNTVRIQLTQRDYLLANRVHLMSRLRYVFVVVVAVIVVTGVLPNVHEQMNATDILSTLGDQLVIVGAILAVGFLVVNFVTLPRTTRRIFNQQKSLQRPYEMSWDRSGVTTVRENGTGSVPWREFLKWRANKEIFVIYMSDAMFPMVPKALLGGHSASRCIRETASRKDRAEAGAETESLSLQQSIRARIVFAAAISVAGWRSDEIGRTSWRRNSAMNPRQTKFLQG